LRIPRVSLERQPSRQRRSIAVRLPGAGSRRPATTPASRVSVLARHERSPARNNPRYCISCVTLCLTPTASSTLSPHAGLPLIGPGGAEWEWLQAAWLQASAGAAAFALVTGEAGIGKSRLAEELLTWAYQQAVARTRSYVAEDQLSLARVADRRRSDVLRGESRQAWRIVRRQSWRFLPNVMAVLRDRFHHNVMLSTLDAQVNALHRERRAAHSRVCAHHDLGQAARIPEVRSR
jgi:hypothetical protein